MKTDAEMWDDLLDRMTDPRLKRVLGKSKQPAELWVCARKPKRWRMEFAGAFIKAKSRYNKLVGDASGGGLPPWSEIVLWTPE